MVIASQWQWSMAFRNGGKDAGGVFWVAGVRSSMVTIPVIGVFCTKMSPEMIYVSFYKLTLGFYLLSVTVFCGIDLVAVIANVFENAKHGCQSSQKTDQKIFMTDIRKGNKIVFQCRNTCLAGLQFKNGIPVSDSGKSIGISSILKVVSYYRGEAEFSVKDGMFVTNILLHII